MRCAKLSDNDIMNDYNEEKTKQLQELKRQNAERWKKLKLLHSGLPVPETTDETDTATTNLPCIEHDPRVFLREVVETHDELVQAEAILQQRLEHERKKLASMKELLQQNQELHLNLEARMQSRQQIIVSPNESTTEDSTNEALQQEHEWLTGELTYVTGLIDKEIETSGLWSLERLLQELLTLKDPYLLTSSLPIHPKHVELLERCYVIEHSEDNADLIRLTNYLGESDR